ncbi:extracellular solute-binding protein [Paenibacillus arenilitoris]|uniref:Extracellular solute-binding protein n=1 Tax=Paenibacillus arenilitoris TaxID=2772299 RepID=A0A927H5Q4_9BACL|nr:extracellular solute-binding protein [Paenibacillus arenilitoris]MBD2867799.1 extracellular solute-binding protein [Paenibacillus arenilitoris]
MKKKKSLILAFVVLVLLVTACSSGTPVSTGGETEPSNNAAEPPSGNNAEPTESTGNSGDNSAAGGDGGEQAPAEKIAYKYDPATTGEITFWTWDAMFKEVIGEFKKVYPNIKVNMVQIEIGQLHDRLQTTIAAGKGAPDVSHVLGVDRYGAPGLLEDLLDPKYDMGRYEDKTAPYVWERWKSVDGKRLLAPPWDIGPAVFYYREDIYEQMGLPSDPEELGEFLQNEDNVFLAAQTLAANGIYMYEWRDSPAIQFGDASGYFDSEMNYLRNNERMVELLDLVKRGVQIGWAPQKSVLFSDEGKELLKQGKVASFPAASNGSRHLANVVPEQKGKWRATKVPLGVNASLVGSSFVIPSQSKNKEAAFAFLEFIAVDEAAWKIYVKNAVQSGWKHITSLPWYQDYENEFLGGQKEFAFYDTLVDSIPVRRYTPLDGQAWPIYIDLINQSIDKNIDSKTTLQQIETNTLRQLGPEIEKLKKEQGIE